MRPYSPTRRSALLLTLAGLGATAMQPGAYADTATARTGWTTGPSLPEPVQEIYPCLHRGAIHLAGGFIAENGSITGPTGAHYAMDPASGRWSARAELPVARHHPQLVSFRGRLFCIGGFEARENGAWQMQGDMWMYNDTDDTWEWAPDLPVPNGESVAGVIGRELFLVGGRRPKGDRNLDWADHTDTGQTLMFDGRGWQTVAPMPTARNSAAGGVIDGWLHVVGGRTVDRSNTAVHEVYDPASDRWERVAPMPQAQGGLAAAVVGHKLYTFGGEYFGGGGGVYSQAWAYDQWHDSWSRIPDMPSPRHGLGAVTIGNSIHILGGARRPSGSETSAAVEIYTP